MIEEFAPAKVNLTLRVLGRRADGYHLLDSLVVFTSVGDKLRLSPGARLTLAVRGPFAAALDDPQANLVVRACRLLAERLGRAPDLSLTLDKRLPVAAGLGGGSADAAAALRGVSRLWSAALPPEELHELALRLGADVPACLAGKPLRMAGVGEQLSPLPAMPPIALLLANPRLPLSTAAVFKAHSAPFSAPEDPPAFDGLDALATFLAGSGNDLEPTAIRLCPEIAGVLAALARQPGCRLARMSGSGPTCFGLFATAAEAAEAAQQLAREQPGWWVAA